MSDIDGLVVAIQGRDVATTAPADGDVLTWDAGGSEWKPSAPSGLQPWVGTVNTQRQVIQRIPFTCRTTGTAWSSTGVQYTLPTDSGVSMFVSLIARSISQKGVAGLSFVAVAANNSGSISSPGVNPVSGGAVSGTSAGNPLLQLTVSGTTVTLEASVPIAGSGVDVDWQGFVDLIGI